ncbi:MAG TPA: hypothetical protein VFE47_07155 [Tepidisphaeraceae bacterium]|jgi:alpha-glucosidase|nr:hypothetical protein [Tepidisphaeraceae bacterium]
MPNSISTLVCGLILFTLPICQNARGADAPSDSTAKPAYTALPADVSAGATTRPVVQVGPISDELRSAYHLDPFYKKTASIDGIVIIASDKVSDYALLECAWTLDHMLNGRTMAKEALVKAKVRVGILAVTEYTMDIPENKRMGNGAYNDRRSRGLGGLPLATCAEENLLNLRHDPYNAENITIHEFSHTVASAIRRMHPEWYTKLKDAYAQAMKAGLYAKSYAATNEQEYWAEGAQSWFDCASAHNDGGNSTRAQLKAYDPALAALLAEVYGDGEWRYFKTTSPKRPAGDRAHLAGFERSTMPAFDFNNSPRIRALAEKPAGETSQKK